MEVERIVKVSKLDGLVNICELKLIDPFYIVSQAPFKPGPGSSPLLSLMG